MREAAILQGFPQEFKFDGPFVNQYRQIGEAVPPVFARSLRGYSWTSLTQKKTIPLLFKKSKSKEIRGGRTRIGLIDAFCGAGGISLGFEEAGFDALYAFDTDASAVDSFNRNLNPVAEVSDRSRPKIADLISRAVPLDRPYIIVGGPPCQGFSQQRRGDDEDVRNNLVVRYAHVIAQLPKMPSAIVLEKMLLI